MMNEGIGRHVSTCSMCTTVALPTLRGDSRHVIKSPSIQFNPIHLSILAPYCRLTNAPGRAAGGEHRDPAEEAERGHALELLRAAHGPHDERGACDRGGL